MRIRPIKLLTISLLFSLFLTAMGCATIPKTMHPEFETRTKEIKTVGLI